jgi:hypothetical protein
MEGQETLSSTDQRGMHFLACLAESALTIVLHHSLLPDLGWWMDSLSDRVPALEKRIIEEYMESPVNGESDEVRLAKCAKVKKILVLGKPFGFQHAFIDKHYKLLSRVTADSLLDDGNIFRVRKECFGCFYDI